MSERFVSGFSVSPEALEALLGTEALEPRVLRKKLGRKPVVGDAQAALGKDGPAKVDQALTELSTGKPTPAHALWYRRVLPLVLQAHASPLLGLLEVGAIDGHPEGSWSPIFRALGMPTIAKQWGRPSWHFPWRRRSPAVEWPVATLVEPASLRLWQRELKRPWAPRLKTLPNDRAVDHDEISTALAALQRWVSLAKPAMILILDGDR